MPPRTDTINVVQREANYTGSRYSGEVSIATGQREGHGTYIYPNSYFSYEGQWVAGQKEGKGRLSIGEGFYEGDFRGGEIEGSGKQQWADGTVYTGEFNQGNRNGHGVQVYADGRRYEGSWVMNRYSGQGELSFPGGAKYVGAFRAHAFHGSGSLTRLPEKLSYVGTFEYGKYEGDGELNDGRAMFSYSGQFRAGHMDGLGKGCDTQGNICFAGEWNDDQPSCLGAEWDLVAPETGESYVTPPEPPPVEEEAEPDPKDVKKGGKKPEVDVGGPKCPEISVAAGSHLPEILLRVLDHDRVIIETETGRRFRATLFVEAPPPEGDEPPAPPTMIRFGDQRGSTAAEAAEELGEHPPSKDRAGSKLGKASPSPTPSGAAPPTPIEEGEEGDDEEDVESIDEGEDAIEGVIEEGGETKLGGTERWLIPAYVTPKTHQLQVEDVTDLSEESIWKRLETIQVSVHVTAAD